jgi:hypothetical protein
MSIIPPRHASNNSLLAVVALFMTVSLLDHAAAWEAAAAQVSPPSQEVSPTSKFWFSGLEHRWRGHLKGRGTVSRPEQGSILEPFGSGIYLDGSVEGRLLSRLFLGEWGYFDTHYELILSGGDTTERGKRLEQIFPGDIGKRITVLRPVDDDRRLFDLTHTIHETDSTILYHRLDRLSLTLVPNWGLIRIGRQAVTWGNGLTFNPMDLFNPFAPTDVERDYKVGDDMINTLFSMERIGDVQLLYISRRAPRTGEVAWDQASLGGKLHTAIGTTEMDIMVAKHYSDMVIAMGSVGYLGDAAWRLNATWTFLDDDSRTNDYLSLVANGDYSWLWLGKNVYGFLEFFYNGLGEDNYSKALIDPVISERLDRGELFTLGRYYVSGHMRVEIHPLFNLFFTAINNLQDPSGILQSWAVWDIAQDIQITFGENIFYGGNETEFGGFTIPGTHLQSEAPDRLYVWVSYYF